MSYSNHLTLYEQEAGDIHTALIEYLAEAEDMIEDVKLELKDARLIKYSTDFIGRLFQVKDKILNFEKAIIKDKGISFKAVCK